MSRYETPMRRYTSKLPGASQQTALAGLPQTSTSPAILSSEVRRTTRCP